MGVMNNKPKIRKFLYGKLSYEDYIVACSMQNYLSAIEYVYGKLSYSDFVKFHRYILQNFSNISNTTHKQIEQFLIAIEVLKYEEPQRQ